MSTPAKRRLFKDLSNISKYSDDNIFAQPLEDDMLTWTAIIVGPPGTPYENGTFSMILAFDEDYPNQPPEISFISEMYHPNIYKDGNLCADLIKNKWSPSYDVLGILLSVLSLLNDPNISSPANLEAAELYQKDIKEYRARVRISVEASWMDIERLAKKYS